MGVVRTRVGYCGGEKKSPTYRSLGDHTETLQVDFDPAVISYERLLEVFWAGHEPTDKATSRQYAAIVFAHDDEQERAAKTSAAAVAKRVGAPVATEIRRLFGPSKVQLWQFWAAEDYHQKYALRADRALMADLRDRFPSLSNDTVFRDSTAVARLNAYISGDAPLSQLRKELESLGLSEASNKRLLSIVKESPSGLSCGAGDR